MGTTMTSTQRWTLIIGAAASLMAALDTLVVATALSTIRVELGASIEDLEWTVNAYNLTFAVLLMPAAALGDRYGRRRMFVAGMALFTLASAACAISPNVGTLIVARAVQGAGAALLITLSLALVSAVFPAERRGSALGILQGLSGLAVASGPIIGGAVAEGLAWQWIFWLNVPVGLLTLPLAAGKLKESRGSDTALDLPGLVLVTGGAFFVVWGLVRGNPAGWDSAEVVGALAGGALLIAAFVAWQLRARQPMLPMRLFRDRGFSAGNAATFFTLASLFSAVFFFAQFLQTALGYGPLGAGLRLLPWTMTLFFCAPVAGALADRIGERPLVTTGLALQAVGMGWIALIAEPGLSYTTMIAPLMIAGCGISMALPSLATSAVSSVSEDAIGKAAGINSTMRELGGVLGIAVAVAVFSSAGGFASPQDFTDGFVPAITTAAAFSFAGALAGLFLRGRRAVVPSLPESETVKGHAGV